MRATPAPGDDHPVLVIYIWGSLFLEGDISLPTPPIMSSTVTNVPLHRGWPPELSDLLIDQLQDSKRALANCSLVCHAWVNRSRYHLFKEVNVTHPVTLEEFTAFLQTSPHLSFHIARLNLHGVPACDYPGYASRLQLSIPSLTSCIQKLPSLDELVLDGVAWKEPIELHEMAQGTQTACWTHPLRRLNVRSALVSSNTLFTTLGHFPRLRDLLMEDILWPAGEPLLYEQCPAPRADGLRSISMGSNVSFPQLHNFLPMLQHRYDLSNLQSITLHFEQFDQLEAVRRFMDDARTELKSLNITIGDHAYLESSRESLALCGGRAVLTNE